MKNIAIILLLCSLAISCSENPWKDLFDPSKIDFRISGTAEWSWNGSLLTARGDSTISYMITKKEYENFELVVEFKPDSLVNSGIFIRCMESEMSDETCYELNIWDHHPLQQWRTGAVVKRVTSLNYVETVGQWNKYRILAFDGHIQAWINDTEVVNLQDDELTAGTIGIQCANGGVIQFRDMKIRQIKKRPE